MPAVVPARDVNAITLEVIRGALTAAADEMGLALARAAYSTNIKTRRDFSCALFDRDARLIAQSFGQPNHLGSLTYFVPRIIQEYGVKRLQSGDALLCNGGRHGGVHLNDVCLVSPVFDGDVLRGFTASIAHHVDVGGGEPGSISGRFRESYEEGINVPPVRLMRGGEFDDDTFRFFLNNVRSPHETGGEMGGKGAALRAGHRRFDEIADRYGWETLEEAVDALLRYTEKRARAELADLPDGRYAAVQYMDDDGIGSEPVKVAVEVIIASGRVIFDLSGSDLQRPCAINATYAMTLSSCAYILRALISDDVPVNDGFYRTFDVVAPEGSIVNCLPPVGISGGWETAFRVLEVGFEALSKAMPEKLAAGSKGCLCNIAFGGSGRDDDYFVFYEAMGGGYGARAMKDGIDGVQAHVQNTENAPVEETEAAYPVRIERYELRADSEGAGRFRGGLGLRRDYVFEHPVTFSVLADRGKFAPWAIEGGQPAACARYIVNPGSEKEQEVSSKTTIRLAAGDIFSVQTAGGGGYGDPRERDPKFVLADLAAGKVSEERAAATYGVGSDGRRIAADDPVVSDDAKESR